MAPTLLLTIDVESDWGGRSIPSSSNVSAAITAMPRLINIFDQHKIPATWFFAGETVPFLADELRVLCRYNHEIASHAYCHRDYARYTQEMLRDDLIRSRQTLQLATGHRAVSFRAPRFFIHPFHNQIIRECGFKFDCSRIANQPSFEPSQATPGCPINNLDLIKLPPLGIKPGLLFIDKIGISLFSSTLKTYPHDYLVIYMHPFDFISPLPPPPRGTPLAVRLWHHLSIHNRYVLLEKIIRSGKEAGCAFATVAEYCRDPFAIG